MPTFDQVDIGTIVGLTGVIVGLVFGVCTWYYAAKAKKLGEQVAQAQGVFASPELEINLFEQQDVTDFILAVPLVEQRYLAAPLKVLISNTGDKSAVEVSIFISMSKDLAYGGQLRPVFSSPSSKVLGKVFHETEHLVTYLLSIASLNPREGIVCPFEVSLRSDTFIKSSVTAPLPDGTTVRMAFTAEFAYRIDLVVTQRDQIPVSRSFNIRVVDTSKQSAREALQEIAKRRGASVSKQGPAVPLLRRIFARVEKRKPWVRTIAVIQYDNETVSDKELPINRFSSKGTVTVNRGVETSDQFYVPSLTANPAART